jgi:preprotein translocase subunit SecD
MNRYPVWKYLLIAFTLVLGVLYTLPNFYGEAPAVQVSSGKSTLKLSAEVADRLASDLTAQGLTPDGVFYEQNLGGGTVKLRFNTSEEQLKARDLLQARLNPDLNNPDYIVALNLLSRSPDWLTNINALPMYLGLDLRGGVHFLLQVDMNAALEKRKDSLLSGAKQTMRDQDLRYSSAVRTPAGFSMTFRDAASLDKARAALEKSSSDLQFSVPENSTDFILNVGLAAGVEQQAREYALRQNITTLHNRINELGVAEPVIQRQGLVDDSPEAQSALASGIVPFGLERYTERGGRDLLLRPEVILTGENLTDAQAGFDNQTQEAAVHLTLDSQGARIFRAITAESIGKRMAIVLVEKGKGEVITAPVIRAEIGGGRVQISGSMNTVESADLALLLRAGSLAAPMDIIEERTIGPSLGADNIDKGISSTVYGFVVLGAFMVVYYLMFGVFSVFALGVNVLLLFALLSVLQATLTLPGLAAVALTLGMAIDANVLINERIREELRDGAQPQQAIFAGYERAWATILDSNITTLIAGLALLVFGSGPVRGFAVVHCLGIVTSIFSSVVVSRAVVNLWYGRKKKLDSVSIGQIWRPDGGTNLDNSVAKKA